MPIGIRVLGLREYIINHGLPLTPMALQMLADVQACQGAFKAQLLALAGVISSQQLGAFLQYTFRLTEIGDLRI